MKFRNRRGFSISRDGADMIDSVDTIYNLYDFNNDSNPEFLNAVSNQMVGDACAIADAIQRFNKIDRCSTICCIEARNCSMECGVHIVIEIESECKGVKAIDSYSYWLECFIGAIKMEDGEQQDER